VSNLKGDPADVDFVDQQLNSLLRPRADKDRFGLVGVHCQSIQIEPVVYSANTVGEGRHCCVNYQWNVQLRVISVLCVVNTERIDHMGDRRHVQQSTYMDDCSSSSILFQNALPLSYADQVPFSFSA
jgi:hypothetical protein